MLIKFWGVRGSISAPGSQTIRYGGNTPCVQISDRAGATCIVDAGYGVVGLGDEMMAAGATRGSPIHLILTHLHWDHIQGLPFFVPIYIPGNQLIIHSASSETARDALDRLFTSVYSPIQGVENLGADIQFETLDQELELGLLRIQPIQIKHSVPTFGVKVSEEGKTLIHATDHEGGIPADDERLIAAAEEADLLVHDAQFTAEEHKLFKGWGHSHTGAAVANALAARVKKMALFHYDPSRTDEGVDRQLQLARELCRGSALEVTAASEGLSIQV